MRVDHEIFHTPNKVELSVTDRPVPESYARYVAGRGLRDTMPMWRVQTEGYLDKKGMLVGVVAKNLDDGPDGEFIAAGENSKGPDAMAIGRQGSYFHWGFAASPTYMTEEAKLVFLNSIHYISKFEGQRAFELTKSVLPRSSVEMMLYQLSDEGSKAWKASMEKAAAEEKKKKAELLARKEKGEELTKMEESRLKFELPSWSRKDAIRRVPEELKKVLGEDLDRYEEYYSENLPYLHGDSEQWYGPLEVDEDAKKLGIPNNELKLLDKCIELLEGDKEKELALRVLKRYTNEEFETAKEWRNWLSQYREYLFFSESSGYKFILHVNRLIADGKGDLLKKGEAEADDAKTQKLIDKVDVEEPGGDDPVTFAAEIVPVNADKKDGRNYKLIVKFRIHDGWHIYADVPAGEAYVPTTLKVDKVEGLTMKRWVKSSSVPSLENSEVSIWENECVFSKDIVVEDLEALQATVKLELSYQVCNENSCLPPQTTEIELKFAK